MTAILFGSISSLADTSELQREAFNAAFVDHGLDWRWDRAEYRSMLDSSGGRDRVAQYAAERGEQVDADAVHATKSMRFQQALPAAGIRARPGVVATISAAKEAGLKVALVTTTSPENVAALSAALAEEISFESLDLIVDATRVTHPKPDAEVYAFALARLGEDAASCVAVEDNLGGVSAARAAGVAVVAFPNVNTADHDFSGATATSHHLAFSEVVGLIDD